jgi:SAM-dependent methyltransferase
VPDDIDTSIPHEARVYDYLLGGKDNYAVDRAVGDQILQVTPQMPVWARHNREFLNRAVRFVAGQGIDQFLDIGTGLPTQANTHEAAHRVNPDARVVYVDYDPIVLAHAQALLDPKGTTAYIENDLRESARLLVEAGKFLDLNRPTAIMLVAVLHHIRDDEAPGAHVRALLDAVPVGSYLVLSHATYDFLDPDDARALRDVLDNSPMTFRARTREEIDRAFLTDLDIVEPGLVATTDWRIEPGDIGTAPDTTRAGHWAVVARKTRA